MMLMASVNHLLMLFIAVEMASLPGYALAGFLKGRRLSSEAALKYVVYGGGAAGVMLYGISLVAGKFGTGYLPDVAYCFAWNSYSRSDGRYTGPPNPGMRGARNGTTAGAAWSGASARATRAKDANWVGAGVTGRGVYRKPLSVKNTSTPSQPPPSRPEWLPMTARMETARRPSRAGR